MCICLFAIKKAPSLYRDEGITLRGTTLVFAKANTFVSDNGDCRPGLLFFQPNRSRVNFRLLQPRIAHSKHNPLWGGVEQRRTLSVNAFLNKYTTIPKKSK